MKSITKTTIFIGLLCALSGCGVGTKVKMSPYSFDFLNSSFYRGYTVLVEEQSCTNAIEYFRTGLDNDEYVEVSTLYYDYCIESDESEVGNYFVSSLSLLNGDRDNWRSNGLSDDEFMWINNMSEQGGTVEQFAIGKMYLNGYILEKNKENGLYFMALSAKGGYGRAQMELAMILMEIGEQQNALLWLEEASKSGYPGAKEMLEGMRLIL